MMVYTYEYDTAYHGPALPVVEIEVGAAGGNLNNRLTLRGVVDSGADATMIPVRHLRRLEAKVVDRRYMVGSADVRHPVDIYAVSVSVGPYAQTAIEVVGNRFNDDVIIGRDVLNHMVVTLNGLAFMVELAQL